MSAGRLHAAVGGWVFTLTPDTDLPDDNFPTIIGEPSWTSSVDEGDLWPSWRQAVAQVSLLFDNTADAADIVKDAVVNLAWSEDPANTTRTGTDLTFEGLVTDVQVFPMTFRGSPCVRVDVTAMDRASARLGQVFPSGTLPAQTAPARLDALLGLSGDPYVTSSTYLPGYGGLVSTLAPTMTAQVLDGSRSLYDLLQEFSRQVPVDLTPTFASGLPGTGGAYPVGVGRGRVTVYPYFNASTPSGGPLPGTFAFWATSLVLKDVEPERLPGYLGATPDIAPGSWGVLIPTTGPGRGDCTIAADKVELGPGWADRTGILPNAVKVNSPAMSWETWNGDSPRITQAVDASLLNDGVGVLSLADLLLPEEGGSNWWMDTMTWRIDLETVPTGRGTWPRFGELVTIADLPAAFQPDLKPWVVGTMIRYQFKMTDGTRPTMDVTLKPQLRGVIEKAVAASGTFDHAPTGLLLSNANTVFTFDDLRMAKGGLAP